MNEKRLIDANALTDAIEKTDWYHISLQGNLAKGARSDIHTPLYKADDIYKALNEAPTVDAVEVVWCKDCKHYIAYRKTVDGLIEWGKCGLISMDVDMPGNGYCCYGERRNSDG